MHSRDRKWAWQPKNFWVHFMRQWLNPPSKFLNLPLTALHLLPQVHIGKAGYTEQYDYFTYHYSVHDQPRLHYHSTSLTIFVMINERTDAYEWYTELSNVVICMNKRYIVISLNSPFLEIAKGTFHSKSTFTHLYIYIFRLNKEHWCSTVQEEELTNKRRHHLPFLHKQAHNKKRHNKITTCIHLLG